MIDHTGLLVVDLDKSVAFYRAALAPLGYVVMLQLDAKTTGKNAVAGLGVPPKPDFWLSPGAPSEPRQHIAFRAGTRAEVDAFYRAAIDAGGRDNGPPGPRPHYHANYYGAFVRDLDGYNVEAVCHEPA